MVLPAAAEAQRLKGNKRFEARDFAAAEEHYSQGLRALDAAGEDSHNPEGLRCVLLANRSAARAALGAFTAALADADACVALDTSFAKGHLRRGAALAGEFRFHAAAAAYDQAACWARVAHDEARGAECDAFAELCRLRAACYGQREVGAAELPRWHAADAARCLALATRLRVSPAIAEARVTQALSGEGLSSGSDGSRAACAAGAVCILAETLAGTPFASTRAYHALCATARTVSASAALAVGADHVNALADLRLALESAERADVMMLSAAAAPVSDAAAPSVAPVPLNTHSVASVAVMLAQAYQIVGARDEAFAALRRVPQALTDGMTNSDVQAWITALIVRGNLDSEAGDLVAAAESLRKAVHVMSDASGPLGDLLAPTLLGARHSLANVSEERAVADGGDAAAAAEAAATRRAILAQKQMQPQSACVHCKAPIAPAEATPPGGKPLYVNACGHMYHRACFDAWEAGQDSGVYGAAPPSCPCCDFVGPRMAPNMRGPGAAPEPTEARVAAPEVPAGTPAVRWRLRQTCPPALLGGFTPGPSAVQLWPLGGAPTRARYWAGGTREGPAFVATLQPGPRAVHSVCTAQLPDAAVPWGLSASAPMGDTLLLFGGVTLTARAGTPFGADLWAIAGLLAAGHAGAAPPPPPARVPLEGDDAPVRRVLAAAAVLDGVFYVVGGGTHASAAHPAGVSGHAGLWDCWAFTPFDAARPAAGGAWRPVPLTGARPPGDAPGLFGAAAVALPHAGEILLFAGQTNVGYSAEVYALRVATGAVRCLAPRPGEPRPSPRMAAAAALLPGAATAPRVLLAGGGTAVEDAADAWVFDAASHGWSRVAMDHPRAQPPMAPGVAPTFGPPPVFGQQTIVGLAPAEDAAGAARGGATAVADVVAWGGSAFDTSPAGRAVGLAAPRKMGHGFLHALRLEQLPADTR
jgi:hypothetical protein